MSEADAAQARPFAALALRGVRDARVRTIVFAYIFALYSFVQPFGFRHAYPTLAERIAFARSFAGNIGLRLFYGQPHDVTTVNGYTAWRVGGTLAIAAAIFGLLAAVRAQRTEEDAGRTELVLAGPVSRRTVNVAAVTVVAAGTLILWLAEFIGFAVAGVPMGGAAYLALATAAVIPVCAGIGAVTGQLASTSRVALELGGALVALLFLLRVVADTTNSAGWLRWATPLGWAEELRPFAGPRPLVLLLPLAATALLLLAAARLGAGRDIGTGILPARDTAEPSFALLSTPWAQALRNVRGTLLAWAGCIAIFAYVLGVVSNAISSADVSKSLEKQIAKLGVGSIVTPTGYLGFVFIFVVLALSVFVCTQVGAARQEEAGQQLETLLALPVGRSRWLVGRLALAVCAASALSLAAGIAAWAGATTTGTHISLPHLLEAGANALPTAILFLGIAALSYAALPRASAAIAYGLVAIAFLWQLVGAVLTAPHWLLDTTPFAHVGLVPAQPFRGGAALVMIAIGTATALAAVATFRRRDLLGA
jgi:polyether ionophore transport system permease protein